MKKLFLLIFFTVLFVQSSFAQLPPYYNFNAFVGSNSFPFNGGAVAAGKRCQWLIGAGEINQPTPVPAGQNITNIWLHVGNVSGTGNYTNLLIMLGQTSITSLPSGVVYTGQLDTVYFRASGSLTPSGIDTWLNITLDRPYSYNPTMSLIVDAQQCGASGGFTICQQSYSPSPRRCYLTTAPCPQAYLGQDATCLGFGVTVVPATVCNYLWSPQTSGTTSLLYSVKAVSNMVGWAAGAAATVRKTTDGGLTWSNGNPNAGVINGAIYAIDAFDANTAWCTTSPAATFIYRTTNGGTNWTQVFTQTGGFIDVIRFLDANTGLAVGDPVGGRWSIFRSINGGVTWDSTGLYLPQAGSEAGWNNAMDIAGTTGWLGTSNTRAYKTTNTGSGWTMGTTAGLLNGVAVHYNSATLGLIGGDAAPFIVRSTDGGATYGTVTGAIPGSGLIGGIEGFGNIFWAVRSANILLSTASGDNFAISYTATGNLNHIDFAVVNGCPEGWAVGAGGIIVKMANLVGISGNNYEVPAEYKLEQNYPNPFNPVTKISYSLPKAGDVELKIFDILGREVATLVHENKQAGNYTIDFDGSSLASGVYLYKIVAGDFIDTKKMMLIK